VAVEEATTEETPFGRHITSDGVSGTCTLIVNDEERQLRQWDYFHR
jgi:hypothetical protein